jgi:hypothetical protein
MNRMLDHGTFRDTADRDRMRGVRGVEVLVTERELSGEHTSRERRLSADLHARLGLPGE